MVISARLFKIYTEKVSVFLQFPARSWIGFWSFLKFYRSVTGSVEHSYDVSSTFNM